MRQLMVSLSLAAILAGGLAACSSEPRTPTQPKLASEGECRGAVNPARCKFQHDLAGGYPFTLDYSNDPD